MVVNLTDPVVTRLGSLFPEGQFDVSISRAFGITNIQIAWMGWPTIVAVATAMEDFIPDGLGLTLTHALSANQSG